MVKLVDHKKFLWKLRIALSLFLIYNLQQKVKY
jgi:hypothetical protein